MDFYTLEYFSIEHDPEWIPTDYQLLVDEFVINLRYDHTVEGIHYYELLY